MRDPEQKVAGMYGTSGWPESYIIDRQGVLRRKVVGPINWESPEVMQFLSQAVGCCRFMWGQPPSAVRRAQLDSHGEYEPRYYANRLPFAKVEGDA